MEDDREWERRLERCQTSAASLDVFCLQEGVSRSTFYRWKRRLDEGLPESMEADAAEPEQIGSTDSLFLPRSLRGEQGIELDERQLNRLLTGLDLRTGRRRKPFRRVG